jgi:PAS domain S-box-containing protein
MNRAGLDMIDADSLEQVKGLCIYPLVTEEYREAFKAMVEGVFRGDAQTLEFKALGLKGRPIWLLSHAVPLRNETGEITSMVSATIDITERKQAEEALKESEERFRNFFEGAPDAMLITDPETGFIFDANSAASRMMQRPHEEIVGLHQSELHLRRMDEHSMSTFKEHAQEKKGLIPVENYLVRPDGTEVTKEVLTQEITLKGKTFLLGTFRDITERKRAEELIKKSLLEKEVLLKEIHHRVKNNMAIISSLLQLQSRYVKDETLGKIINDSRNRIGSMALIHEMLYQSEDFTRIDLKEYIQALINKLFASYKTKKGSIRLETDIDDIQLDIDKLIPCGLILNELITNSLKHAFRGRNDGEIRIGFKANDSDTATISVSDNGCGLPAGMDIGKSQMLGFDLINSLARQLRGDLEYDGTDGMSVKITFKFS